MEKKLIEVMVDAVKGNPLGEYTKGQTSEAIRNAMIEMNGGKNKIDLKKFYRGSELYNLVQEIIPVIIDEGFRDDDPLFNLVEYRNIADGDEQEFVVQANSLYVVADAAAGIRGVRRQRVDDTRTVTISTSVKIVRIYEELNRLLAGKVSFDTFVENVGKSFKQAILAEAYKVISAIGKNTSGLSEDYIVAGSLTDNEDKLVDLVARVEAATGKTARIYGTKAALRKIKTAVVSHEAETDLYNMGYYGKANGTELVCMRQTFIPGTNKFALDDTKLYVIAADDKPVKVVNEGDGILYEGDALQNNDLTQEYVYGQPFGVGVICAQKLGIFTISD